MRGITIGLTVLADRAQRFRPGMPKAVSYRTITISSLKDRLRLCQNQSNAIVLSAVANLFLHRNYPHILNMESECFSNIGNGFKALGNSNPSAIDGIAAGLSHPRIQRSCCQSTASRRCRPLSDLNI